MRGPFYNSTTGVTGEPHDERPAIDFTVDKSANYETYEDSDGTLRTRLVAAGEAKA